MPARRAHPVNLDSLAHTTLTQILRPGMLAVDATAGNGHDTAFLASLLGPSGHVWAMDVQRAALEATRARLSALAHAAPVTLIHAGHETLNAHLPAALRPHAAMFNLGYLPGSDKRIATTAATTLAALDALLPRMAPGGVLSLHVYTGHPGGAEELDALLPWACGLSYPEWSLFHTNTANRTLRPEHLLLIQRHI